MPDLAPPPYELAIAPQSEWPTNGFNERTKLNIVRRGSGKLVAQIPIDLQVPRGRVMAIQIARHLIKLHNEALAQHRRAQARIKATRLKLINERKAT